MKDETSQLGGVGEARVVEALAPPSLYPQSLSHRPQTAGATVFSKVMRAYRVELDPTKKQAGLFLRYAGTARFIWNWALAQRMEAYKANKKSLNCSRVCGGDNHARFFRCRASHLGG